MQRIFDKAPAIDHRTIGGEAFIITAEDSRIHSLNDTASFIFDRCDGRTSIAAIASALAETFEISHAQAAEDAGEFALELARRGMLVEK